MTAPTRTTQEVLADQFRLTLELGALTGEYHRLLQKVSAAGFARQLTEDRDDAESAAAELAEIAAQMAADSCDVRVKDLESQLNALARELSDLR